MEQQQKQVNEVRITLKASIDTIQQAAKDGVEKFFELGVFIFFSNANGDAWLLEVTDQDAVQVAQGGEPLDIPIEEDSETIEINWTHIFELKNRQLYLTAYEDKKEIRLDDAPTQQINAVIRRIKKRYSKELLDQVHVPQESEA